METKMSQADEQYRADLLAQEKKFKMQAKKNKEEFRKLLNANGVNDQVLCLTLLLSVDYLRVVRHQLSRNRVK